MDGTSRSGSPWPGGASRRALLFWAGGAVHGFSTARRGGWVPNPTRPPRRGVENPRRPRGSGRSDPSREFSMPRPMGSGDRGQPVRGPRCWKLLGARPCEIVRFLMLLLRQISLLGSRVCGTSHSAMVQIPVQRNLRGSSFEVAQSLVRSFKNGTLPAVMPYSVLYRRM